MNDEVQIQGRDYWFKVIEMLQQNWALIDSDAAGVVVYFFDDTGGVFDEMHFRSQDAAKSALQANGFRRFADDASAASFMQCPKPPFIRCAHPNGSVYSSGRFWRT